MTTINLLPWREQRREEQKQQFFIALGAALALVAVIVILVHLHYGRSISMQNARNQKLQTEIALLDQQIAQIKALKKEKESLIARMNIIQELQTNRPLAVHLFDSLVAVIPDGIHFISVQRTGLRMTVVGWADSNTHVSNLMRNIELSDWLSKPKLNEIKTITPKDSAKKPYKEFTLTFMVHNPNKPTDEDGELAGEGSLS